MHRTSSPRPFLYVVGWTELNTWYLGVRYSRDCHPVDIWTTYFTSSRHVSWIREQFGEPDVVCVLAEGSRSDVLLLEQTIIRKFNLHRHPNWLNRCMGGKEFETEPTPELRKKRSEAAKAQWADANNGLRTRRQPQHQASMDKLVTAWGEKRTLGSWLAKFPLVTHHQFKVRLNQGWTVERALEQKPRKRRSLK